MSKKYKLINKYTNEEHTCTKVVIDGFDYYVSDTEITLSDTIKTCYYIFDNTLYERVYSHHKQGKKVVATNNFSIDLPQVINLAEELAKSYLDGRFNLDPSTIQTFERLHTETYTAGYNEHAESYPNSDEDMIKFHQWAFQQVKFNPSDLTTKELLEIWKSQQPKTIYYV